MSQTSSSSNAEFAPIQLSLFTGEFETSKDHRSRQDGSTSLLSENSDHNSSAAGLGLFGKELDLSSAELASPSAESLCPLAAEFMQVFEAISGWEVHFQESVASRDRQALETHGRDGEASTKKQAPQGKFEIIDMSIDWPAKTATMHRGKCDQLIKLFSDLYDQARTTQENLGKVQGLLSTLTNSDENDDQLVDSFAPALETSDTDEDSDFVLCQGNDFSNEDESAFIVKQEFDSGWLPEMSVWSDWSIAGASGIVGESYLDWSQQGDVLTVYAGRIESSLGVGDTESSLEVNAVSRQFKVREDNTLAAFFLWDRRGGKLQSVKPGSWQTLYSEGAIVVSTDPTIEMPDSIVNAQLGTGSFTAEQLAAAIELEIGADHRVVVIKCD